MATKQQPDDGILRLTSGQPSPIVTVGAPVVRHRDEYRLNIETWFRGIALMLVVIAVVLYPFYALVAHIAPATLSQVIAPITGIAGAVVGYWFGQSSRRANSTGKKNTSGT